MKKDLEFFIKQYEEEAEANLQLYLSGKDDNAYQRYRDIMQYVRGLRQRK